MHRTPFKYLRLSALFILLFYACEEKDKPLTEEYLGANAKFRSQLLQGRDHYLKLIGLHPLANGTNFFGSSSDNNIQLATTEIPATIGVIEFSEDEIWFTATDSLDVRTVDGDSSVTRWAYEFESALNSPMLKYKHLEWQVIKRGTEFFLRVKDQNSPIAAAFKGFERYPLQSKYVILADYKSYAASKTEKVDTQLGTAQQMDFVGQLTFVWNGTTYVLSIGAGGFVIVGDLTNDDTTYGGGRYVYIEVPKVDGKVTIDFNRLYNPPCVYSEFTTCPLPPAQNVLPIRIEAGEKYAKL